MKTCGLLGAGIVDLAGGFACGIGVGCCSGTFVSGLGAGSIFEGGEGVGLGGATGTALYVDGLAEELPFSAATARKAENNRGAEMKKAKMIIRENQSFFIRTALQGGLLH